MSDTFNRAKSAELLAALRTAIEKGEPGFFLRHLPGSQAYRRRLFGTLRPSRDDLAQIGCKKFKSTCLDGLGARLFGFEADSPQSECSILSKGGLI